MLPHDLAVSRARTWGLLGRLLLEGPGEATAAWVAAIPSLQQAVPQGTPDELAAAHEAVLGREVFPYESVWVSADGQFGGAVAAALQHTYDACGFRASLPGTEPDHVGMQMLALSFLCGAEADALADGVEVAVTRTRALQASLLGGHLMRWLPALAIALSKQGEPLYAEVAQLAVELAASHEVVDETDALPPPLDVLDAPKAGLAAVSRALLVPGRTGWFLSRADIGRIGRSVDLPHGFGARWKMLETLLVTAVEHGRVGEVLAALDAEAASWDEAYRQHAALGMPVSAWRRRLKVTREALARLAEAGQLNLA